jgi:hypothetical protein
MNKGALFKPSFISSKERPPIKKEATLKCNGLKRKTFDRKRGNPKTQGAQKEIPPMEKEATPKRKRLKRKTSDRKRGNLKTQEAQKKDIQ